MQQKTTTREEMLRTGISHWRGYTSRKCGPISVAQAVRKIQWGDADQEDIQTGDQRNAEIYRKMTLSYVSFSGIFDNRCVPEKLLQPAGLVSVDYENLHLRRAKPANWKNRAVEHLDSCALAMATPSGNGVRLVIQVSPPPQDPREHALAFESATAELEKLKMTGWNRNGRNMCLLTPLAQDPWIMVAETLKPLVWRDVSGSAA